jgi:hypothetical protein
MAGELLLAAIGARGGRPLAVIVDDAEWLDQGSVTRGSWLITFNKHRSMDKDTATGYWIKGLKPLVFSVSWERPAGTISYACTRG